MGILKTNSPKVKHRLSMYDVQEIIISLATISEISRQAYLCSSAGPEVIKNSCSTLLSMKGLGS